MGGWALFVDDRHVVDCANLAEQDLSEKAKNLTKMSAFPRPKLIAGNWKMNGTVTSVTALSAMLSAFPAPSPNVTICVSPTHLHLSLVRSLLPPHVAVAGQNCALSPKDGAFTGEVSASMLVDCGATHVILGHSERRTGFGGPGTGESSTLVASKVVSALSAGLRPILCCGELLAEREAGETMSVVASQLAPVVEALKAGGNDEKAAWKNVVVAYEPVWAIGTGRTASPEQAQETHKAIRAWISDHVSPEVGAEILILYGGSMKGSNAAELLKQEDVDGGLIGGASLTADFIECVKAASLP